jgi:hypothetical protein
MLIQDNNVTQIADKVLEFKNVFKDSSKFLNECKNLNLIDWDRANKEKIGSKFILNSKDKNVSDLYKEIDDICHSIFKYYKDKYKLKSDYEILDRDNYEFLKWNFPMKGMGPHIDEAHNKLFIKHFSMCIYLNDDYEGAEFGFPNHDLYFKAKKNSALVFPSNTTHTVLDLKDGHRYLFTKFFTLTNIK